MFQTIMERQDRLLAQNVALTDEIRELREKVSSSSPQSSDVASIEVPSAPSTASAVVFGPGRSQGTSSPTLTPVAAGVENLDRASALPSPILPDLATSWPNNNSRPTTTESDWNMSWQELQQLKSKSASVENFSVLLVRELFTEAVQRTSNCSGKVPKNCAPKE